MLHRADLALYRRVHRTRTPAWLDTGLAGLTRTADHSKLWLGVATVLATRGRSGRRAALRGVTAIGLASFVANVPAKRLARRKRPDFLALVEAGRLPRRQPVSASFPSGHSASAAAFAVGAASEMPALALPLGAAAVAVGYSRVHTGVHYPGDVLAGFALGAGAAAATRLWWPLPAPLTRATPVPVAPLPGGRGVTVVVNAAAGGGSAEDAAAEIREALPEAKVVTLADPDDLVPALREAANDAVALGVHGGDGSVNAAAEVAYDTNLPLVVVPGGTLNHLARDLGVESVADVARALEEGGAVDLDVAEIDGRPFLNTASFGSYADLVDARERREDRIGKWPAFAVALAAVLREREPLAVRIDGRPRRVWAIFVGNCRYEPSGFAPSYRPGLADGLLDVRVLAADAPWWERRLVRSLHVTASEPLRLARDGETFDGSPDFAVRKRERTVTVYAPRPA